MDRETMPTYNCVYNGIHKQYVPMVSVVVYNILWAKYRRLRVKYTVFFARFHILLTVHHVMFLGK
jgi:hypothetical protein